MLIALASGHSSLAAQHMVTVRRAELEGEMPFRLHWHVRYRA